MHKISIEVSIFILIIESHMVLIMVFCWDKIHEGFINSNLRVTILLRHKVSSSIKIWVRTQQLESVMLFQPSFSFSSFRVRSLLIHFPLRCTNKYIHTHRLFSKLVQSPFLGFLLSFTRITSTCAKVCLCHCPAVQSCIFYRTILPQFCWLLEELAKASCGHAEIGSYRW